MTKEIVYCDRCGKEVVYPIISKCRIFKKRIFVRNGVRVDLCQRCNDDLEKWFNEGK